MYNKQEFLILKPLDKEWIKKLHECKAMLCGGAILSAFTCTPINDYDLYFRSQEDADKLLTFLKKNGFQVMFSSENAVSLINNSNKLKFQLIGGVNSNLLANSPWEIFDKFDFTVCMGAYDFCTMSFCLDSKFLTSIASKELIFNPGTYYPICSLFRVLKYQKKGFEINGLEIISMAMTINQLDIESYQELTSQLRGIDTELLIDFCETLGQEKKPEDKFDAVEFFKIFNEWKNQLYKIDIEEDKSKKTTVATLNNINYDIDDILNQLDSTYFLD